MLIQAEGCVVLLVDLQERLLRAIDGGEQVLANAVRLAEGARLLDVPVRATEQYPKGLGTTVEELAGFADRTIAKTAFPGTADPGFADLLPADAEEIVLAGIEAHVCVLQTALGLVAQRRRVLVAADAVGSRNALDKTVALERMQRNGVEVVTTEMVLFEWVRDAAHPRFREVQDLIR